MVPFFSLEKQGLLFLFNIPNFPELEMKHSHKV